MAHTAKSYTIDKAPKRITLLGDRRRPESAQHIIEFPGGAIEVSRLDDGSYWAHIIVNRGWGDPSMAPTMSGARGQVIASRVDHADVPHIDEIAGHNDVRQIAVLIKPESE